MKIENWEAGLLDSIVRHSAGGFEWGKRDCASFAWNVRNDLLGRKEPPPWGTRHKTPEGAYRAMKRLYGDVSLSEAATIAYGRKPIPVIEAMRGDVVCCPLDGMEDCGFSEALGICVGKVTVFLGKEGLVRADTYAMKHCWRTD